LYTGDNNFDVIWYDIFC